jgi:hypothetical protein
MKITDFVKEKTNMAIFTRFRAGMLYYVVKNLSDGNNYEFPVEAADLMGATVRQAEPAITLMRYIRKALEDGALAKHDFS